MEKADPGPLVVGGEKPADTGSPATSGPGKIAANAIRRPGRSPSEVPRRGACAPRRVFHFHHRPSRTLRRMVASMAADQLPTVPSASAPSSRNRRIPISLERIRDRLGPPENEHSAKIERLLHVMLRAEVDQQAGAMRRELDRLLHPQEHAMTAHDCDVASARLLAQIRHALSRANFNEEDEGVMHGALAAQSLVDLKTHLDRSTWRRALICTRGRTETTIEVRRWFGLRRIQLQCTLVRTLFVYIEHVPRQRGNAQSGLNPPRFYVRLFENIPVADIDMVMPDCRVRMSWFDRAMMFGPAIFAVIGISTVIKGSWDALVLHTRHLAGLDPVAPAIPGGALAAIGGGFLALALWGWTQFGRWQRMHLRYLKILSDIVMYRLCDRDMGAVNQVLDEAGEEETKEALLALRSLRVEGPCTESELDERIERWLRNTFAVDIDFEVDDALAKLIRLGLVERTGRTYAANPPEQSLAQMQQHWNALGGLTT